MITATILSFVAGQVKICTTGPTEPAEKILSVDPAYVNMVQKQIISIFFCIFSLVGFCGSVQQNYVI